MKTPQPHLRGWKQRVLNNYDYDSSNSPHQTQVQATVWAFCDGYSFFLRFGRNSQDLIFKGVVLGQDALHGQARNVANDGLIEVP